MTEPNFDHLANLHTLDGLAVPGIVRVVAGSTTPELVWRNDLGGLTFRLGDRYLKVNPSSTGPTLIASACGWGGSPNGTPRRASSITASTATPTGC
jgi:hypothetical protein